MDNKTQGAAETQAEIDAAFAAMADDVEYLAEAQRIAAEFAVADWEAFRSQEEAEEAEEAEGS